ncbi:MAG: type II toxin-antitoxin system HipA family toxin, partial [Gammaproteobacteria bacterium]|nr:type II toxin-antitoxin system HipA family toxin [Gammaproteobacteria bacterium]
MSFEPVSQIRVSLCLDDTTHLVGHLARRGHKVYFEYDSGFVRKGLEISPIECALRPGVQTFDPLLFEGLPGVFHDSLPDGWGRLLLDRQMRSLGVLPQELSALDRLAHVGHAGMGALVYDPDHTGGPSDDAVSIDTVAGQVHRVLSGEVTDVLAELVALNGSSAGTRPKAMIGLHENRRDVIHGAHEMRDRYEPWLVKFPNAADGSDAGAIEYVYALMAAEAGVAMPDVHLFPAQAGSGYFAVRRFDRKHNRRLHVHTACGLLHSDFRTPSLDYEDLMALTMNLTRDMREVEKMYRLAVFNVLAHNRDDHPRNFSYVMDRTGEWKLSPAYDLTFSSGPRGEQSTMVMGEGKSPGHDALVRLGLEARLAKPTIDTIIEQTRA